MNFSDISVVFDVKFGVQKGKEEIWDEVSLMLSGKKRTSNFKHRNAKYLSE
ncbi:hypothetical protein [Sunxiuqinia indica]|uniref:hypothetical protein n=1 Tax=Sunxiuqinia indica TaxID=2692584 RepID=UPI0013588F57|nr:hypothetical protein [Sunxiuqinia indica]